MKTFLFAILSLVGLGPRIEEATTDIEHVPGLDEFVTTVGTPARLPHGVNNNMPERFIVRITGTAGDVADNASAAVVLPSEFAGRPSMAQVVKAWTYGGGAAGARTATAIPLVDVGSALVGIEATTYVESTGTLTIVNRTGGALADFYVLVEVYDMVTARA